MLADHVPSSYPDFDQASAPNLGRQDRVRPQTGSVRAILLGFLIFPIRGSPGFSPPETPDLGLELVGSAWPTNFVAATPLARSGRDNDIPMLRW
jgi:hypothetical protein